MCYSSLVDRSLKKVASRHRAKINAQAFVDLYAMRVNIPSIKIPDGMDICAEEIGGTAGKSIEKSIREYRAGEDARVIQQLNSLDVEICELQQKNHVKPTKTAQSQLQSKLRKREKLRQPSAEPIGDTYRIFPHHFAPVIFDAGDGREIVPMRYRILPRTGVEIPTQYNVFNARRDSLLSVRSWKPLFGRQHAIFPFRKFYEWVERDEKKVELSFTPDGFSEMWASSLYEECKTENGLIRSFAMVTDEPPAEIAAAGHDRCPVFLREDLFEEWLHPVGKSLQELDALLDHKQPTHYTYALAA